MGKSGAQPQNSGSELFSLVNEARCLDGRFEQPRQGADLQHIDTGGHLEDHLDPFRHLRGKVRQMQRKTRHRDQYGGLQRLYQREKAKADELRRAAAPASHRDPEKDQREKG